MELESASLSSMDSIGKLNTISNHVKEKYPPEFFYFSTPSMKDNSKTLFYSCMLVYESLDVIKNKNNVIKVKLCKANEDKLV